MLLSESPIYCNLLCVKHEHCRLKYQKQFSSCNFYKRIGGVKLNLKLMRLNISNFKGIKSLELNLDGGNVNVFGDNETGKTTIFDAFTWLLFDKDSHNVKDFNIKPLNGEGVAASGVNSEVEGVFEADGQTLILKKVYYEKWTKQRGSAQAVFSGNTTDYYINGVPCAKKEFDARVVSLADEKIFRLTTNPLYFNDALKWEERRKLLLQVCGDISDSEIISKDEALKDLYKILEGRSADDQRKVLAARKKEINQKLQDIPTRIDEVTKGMPELVNIHGSTDSDIDATKTLISQKQSDLVRFMSGGEIAEKKKQLAMIDAEMMVIKNNWNEKQFSRLRELRQEADAIKAQITNRESNIYSLNSKVKNLQGDIAILSNEKARLLEQWKELNAREFATLGTCPTCHQSLPEGEIETARARFNLDKSKDLERIAERGKAYKADIDKKNAEIAELQESHRQESEKLKELELKHKKADEAATVENVTPAQDISSNPEYKAKQAERDSISSEITNLESGLSESADAMRSEIAEFEKILAGLQAEAANSEQIKRDNLRISQLKAEEKKLAAEFEQCEAGLYLIEQFIKAKVSMLTETINSKFKMAKFKLFDLQVNGGLAECCDTTYNGVPFSDLNNAMKINIGMDIINTLSGHFNFTAPIFVDNAESVTKLEDAQTQVVRLVVSEADKKLRIESEDK